MTSILVGLMILLIFSQGFFSNNFREVALLDNNISSLTEYSIKEEGYVYSLPEMWEVKEKEGNSYKLYQLEFNNKENSIMGYVEILSTDEDIKVLAQKDIDNLKLSYKKEKIENYNNKNFKGIKVEYTTKVESGYSFINTNYYLELSDDEVGKFSFVTKKGEYKDNMNAIYDAIVSGMRISNK